MKFFSFFFAIFLASYLAKAHSPATSVRSSSGQFIVHGPAPLFDSPGVQPSISHAPMAGGWFFMITPKKLAQDSSTKPRVALEQNLVAVSCERIKEALGQQVGLADRGAGKIHLYLNPFLREEEITMASTYYSDGWAYAVELPTQIEESRFVKTVVEILLIEQANRSSAGQAEEWPRWLVDGLAAHLQATVQESLALQMNLQTRQSRRFDPLANVREHLRETVPLTFNELSWPENLSSEQAALYQDCAQLFVSQLLRLKEGRAGLRRFIENFAQNKNWQFSFLRAFHFQFGQLIDVEKWWALQLISFTGRDPKQLLSREESWKKMEAALHIPVQLRAAAETLPKRSQLSLQEIIRDWDRARQQATLPKTINQLATLRRRVQPEFIALLDGYLSILKKYLQPGNSVLKKSVCQQLDQLDQQRAKLKSGATTAKSSEERTLTKQSDSPNGAEKKAAARTAARK